MDLLKRIFLGHSKISFHHSPNPVQLNTNDENKATTILEICEAATPPCQLNPFLFNGHLQTMWTSVPSKDIPVYYKRKLFEADNPAVAGSFAVDFVVNPYEDRDVSLPPRTTYYDDAQLDEIGSLDDKPMLVALHGLTGGSHEAYLREMLWPIMQRSIMQQEWEICVVISRGCAQSFITSELLYNARSTWDIRQVVKWLAKVFPNRPLFGLGMSLGANVMINYLGEEGAGCILKAAVVCANPWNLEISSVALQRSWLGLELYSRTMGSNLRNLFELHVEEISKNPRIDVEKVREAVYIHEFDRYFQAPTWGYPTEGAYHRDASSCDSLLAVRVPLFALNAEDDPISVKEALPLQEFAQNPFAVLCTTTLGGHLAWYEFDGGRWFAKPVARFLKLMAREVKSVSSPDASEQATASKSFPGGEVSPFQPMRRRLQVMPDP